MLFSRSLLFQHVRIFWLRLCPRKGDVSALAPGQCGTCQCRKAYNLLKSTLLSTAEKQKLKSCVRAEKHTTEYCWKAEAEKLARDVTAFNLSLRVPIPDPICIHSKPGFGIGHARHRVRCINPHVFFLAGILESENLTMTNCQSCVPRPISFEGTLCPLNLGFWFSFSKENVVLLTWIYGPPLYLGPLM